MALQVKPTLQRLKGTLLGSGTALVLTAGVLFGLVTSGADADGMYGTSPLLLALRLFACVTEACRSLTTVVPLLSQLPSDH